MLQVEPISYDPNNSDYSHLDLRNDRESSPPPPPPPVRHSSKQNSNSGMLVVSCCRGLLEVWPVLRSHVCIAEYENLHHIQAVSEGDYSHLKHT